MKQVYYCRLTQILSKMNVATMNLMSRQGLYSMWPYYTKHRE